MAEIFVGTCYRRLACPRRVDHSQETRVYAHLLIATDGSDLALKAVEQGLALAKALKAKATAITVTESWATIATAEMGMAFPIDDYNRGCADGAAKILETVAKTGRAERRHMLHVPRQRPVHRRGHHRNRKVTELRSHRHVVPRPSRDLTPADRQPSQRGGDPQHTAGADLPIASIKLLTDDWPGQWSTGLIYG
jgi:nucleotide-binding universal stress UspA family protein